MVPGLRLDRKIMSLESKSLADIVYVCVHEWERASARDVKRLAWCTLEQAVNRASRTPGGLAAG